MLFSGVPASPQTVSIRCFVEPDTDSSHTSGGGLPCALLAISIEVVRGRAWLGPVELATSGDPKGDQGYRQESALVDDAPRFIFRRLH